MINKMLCLKSPSSQGSLVYLFYCFPVLDISILGITETNLKHNDSNITNNDVKGFNIEHSPTETQPLFLALK